MKNSTSNSGEVSRNSEKEKKKKILFNIFRDIKYYTYKKEAYQRIELKKQ